MSKFCFYFALALLVLKVDAYKIKFGKCARVISQENFDMQKMLGDWFVIEATSNNKKCLTYSLRSQLGYPGSYLLIESFAPPSIAKFFGVDNNYHRIGVLRSLNVTNPAVMSFKKPREILSYKLTVLSTDYESYALIYACKKIYLGLHQWSAMILSRTPRIERTNMGEIWAHLSGNQINLYSMKRVNHDRCAVTTKPPETTYKSTTFTDEDELNPSTKKSSTDDGGCTEWVIETTTLEPSSSEADNVTMVTTEQQTSTTSYSYDATSTVTESL